MITLSDRILMCFAVSSLVLGIFNKDLKIAYYRGDCRVLSFGINDNLGIFVAVSDS